VVIGGCVFSIFICVFLSCALCSLRPNYANRAMFLLLKICHTACFLWIFNLNCFKNVFTRFCCMVVKCGFFSDIKLCKRFQLRFFKPVLKLNKTTPSCIVLGEVGMFPIELKIKNRMFSYCTAPLVQHSLSICKWV
jgi:hypothetical protein